MLLWRSDVVINLIWKNSELKIPSELHNCCKETYHNIIIILCMHISYRCSIEFMELLTLAILILFVWQPSTVLIINIITFKPRYLPNLQIKSFLSVCFWVASNETADASNCSNYSNHKEKGERSKSTTDCQGSWYYAQNYLILLNIYIYIYI